MSVHRFQVGSAHLRGSRAVGSLPEPLPLAVLLSLGLAPYSGRLLPAAPSVPRWEVGEEHPGAGLCGVDIRLFQEDLSYNEPRGFDFPVPS